MPIVQAAPRGEQHTSTGGCEGGTSPAPTARPWSPGPPRFPEGPAALIIGHPGHELRVHGWLEKARPLVCVLTDGSGSGGRPRLASTTQVLLQTGGQPGPLYGRYPDRVVYEALLAGNSSFFLRIVAELADTFLRAGVQYVVGDASEGYNPTHDVCRLLIDAAVARAADSATPAPANYDFLLAGPPNVCPAEAEAGAGTVRVRLDDDALVRKLNAARLYAGLEGEAAAALEAWGPEAFRQECFRPAGQGLGGSGGESPPFYESHGLKRVQAGCYRQVLRYREHVRPLALALCSNAQRSEV